MIKNILYNRTSGLCLLLILITGASVNAQDLSRATADEFKHDENRKIILLPDIPGFETLTGDFHMHTVFSDGNVWPTIRVKEAWLEGLDVVAISDHIEYLPHKEFMSGDLNSSYEIARDAAEQYNILLVKAAEITRSMPPGHLNALFIEDATVLDHEDPMVQIERAANQGAFLLWNHPGWEAQQPDSTKWWDYHTEILEKGWLHGIEVFNWAQWYPVALGWCIDKDLTVFANSDLHDPSNMAYDLSGKYSHRPMTILFSRDRSLDGVKEALFEGRTLGWFDNTLVGKEELIGELCRASVTVELSSVTKGSDGKEIYHYEIMNPTHLSFSFRLMGEDQNGRIIELLPETGHFIKTEEMKEQFEFELVNCYSDMEKHPTVVLTVL